MADMTEGDNNVIHLGLEALALISFIAGLVIHSFIIGVNVTDWWKGRSVTPVDQIITSLGISRICAHCADTLYMLLFAFFLSSLDLRVVLVVLGVGYAFFSYVNIWLTTLLSIVFYLKISNLHTRLFLYLRRMILHRIVYFIVAALLLSAFSVLMPFLLAIALVINDRTHNTTMDNLYIDCKDINSFYNYIIVDIIPLLFYYISSVLLFSSLYHHTTRMKMSSNLSINLETYYSVMRFVFFTLLCNTIYFIGHLTCDIYFYFYCVNLQWLYTVLDFLPLLHSSYLIYRTAKLRTQMSKVFYNVIHFLRQRKNTETRETIEIVAL